MTVSQKRLAERDRKNSIIKMLGEVATDWKAEHKDQYIDLTARPRINGAFADRVTLARLEAHEVATANFLMGAHADLVFLLGLLDRAAQIFLQQNQQLKRYAAQNQPDPTTPPKDKPDYAAQCAMKCAEPAFQQFMAEQSETGEIPDAAGCAELVRKVSDVKSRANFNDFHKWLDLLRRFDDWQKRK